MLETRGWRRLSGLLELAACTLLVAAIACSALRRMDYLSADGSEAIRMTDASRNALVARNIALGNGYSTNDLPAALVDFYDQRGKLHDEHWVNADRFPFASYAIAALYKVTGSTSWVVGILVYALLCFVGFLILLYHCGRSLWDDRYAGLLAVALALLHPYTYMFLYWKDADMLLLTTACMAMLYRYFRLPVGEMRWRFAVVLGTLLAWLFLSRPNLGAPFVLAFGVVTLSRIWRAARGAGAVAAIRRHLGRELLVLLAALAWVLPFVVHSLRTWGSPLFSANNLYQLPLGTRFGMGTDTWWKYTEPGHMPTLGTLMHDGTGELTAKFTSSWVATLKNIAMSYPVEILLACGLVVWLGRRPAADPMAPAPRPAGDRPARRVASIVLFALILNLAVLPLYGYKDYSYRHYLGFGLPLLWLAGGRALSLLGVQLVAGIRRIATHVGAHRAVYAAVAVVAAVAANAGANDPDAGWAFGRISKLIGAHWVVLVLAIVVVLLRRVLIRPPWFPRITILAFSLVYACYRPNPAMKRVNLVWLTADHRVWNSLQQRTGIVSSFALQGEVAWNTGRKNIPAPEWPMHIYSLAHDHHLAIEDVYLESAGALTSTVDGPFAIAAPGFEGYARLQRWRTLPGYEVAFHGEVDRGYSMFRIKPHFKASTDFRLSDPAAVAAMMHSPDHIALSDPRQVIYTAFGWGDYYDIDGKPVVAATDITRDRYRAAPDAPYEDTGITFFLDDRRPTSVDVELYAPGAATYHWFWNLDLYAYDRAKDRPAHAVGTTTFEKAGWHTAHLVIPPGVTRAGLNKLGFRAATLRPVVLCPQGMSDETCAAEHARRATIEPDASPPPPAVVRPTGLTEIAITKLAMFASSVELHYERATSAAPAPTSPAPQPPAPAPTSPPVPQPPASTPTSPPAPQPPASTPAAASAPASSTP
jgi:hypothetical protein